ncbi:hypothetical protein J6590_009466 [Homalodisca vitripennis]|nr:hypothetical protein J6590_009466 [Homalodisca vitripennis]
MSRLLQGRHFLTVPNQSYIRLGRLLRAFVATLPLVRVNVIQHFLGRDSPDLCHSVRRYPIYIRVRVTCVKDQNYAQLPISYKSRIMEPYKRGGGRVEKEGKYHTKRTLEHKYRTSYHAIMSLLLMPPLKTNLPLFGPA